MNVMFLGGRDTGHTLSRDLIQTFQSAHSKEAEWFGRHLAKVAALEREMSMTTSIPRITKIAS
jgi:hypothetical protein